MLRIIGQVAIMSIRLMAVRHVISLSIPFFGAVNIFTAYFAYFTISPARHFISAHQYRAFLALMFIIVLPLGQFYYSLYLLLPRPLAEGWATFLDIFAQKLCFDIFGISVRDIISRDIYALASRQRRARPFIPLKLLCQCRSANGLVVDSRSPPLLVTMLSRMLLACFAICFLFVACSFIEACWNYFSMLISFFAIWYFAARCCGARFQEAAFRFIDIMMRQSRLARRKIWKWPSGGLFDGIAAAAATNHQH